MAVVRRAKIFDSQLRCLSWSNAPCRFFHSSKQNEVSETNKDRNSQDSAGDDEFPVFEIEGLKKKNLEKRAARPEKQSRPPRFRNMAVDQDWTDVWPTVSSFKWSAVPFPVRQGFINSTSENKGIVPSKYANLELMKPPNFLHLTPAHIAKHCHALKQFCTKWPEELESDEKCWHHFPLESVTSDYIFAAPSQRDERARVASISFYLSDLKLDYHARDKFIRLVGDRYNPATDKVVFESDRCPLKSQNLDYVTFLLTAIYFESWKTESWEKLKELSDMEKYFWDINQSKKSCLSILQNIQACKSKEGKPSYLSGDALDEESVCNLPEVQNYKVSVEELFNEGENIETIKNYKAAVKTLLNIQSTVT